MVKVGVQLLARVVGGGWTKTKLMLNSTQVEVKVEVGVELGNIPTGMNRSLHRFK